MRELRQTNEEVAVRRKGETPEVYLDRIIKEFARRHVHVDQYYEEAAEQSGLEPRDVYRLAKYGPAVQSIGK